MFYSTPTRYIDAVYEADLEWTVKTDDFFPYADNSYAYWTGKSMYRTLICAFRKNRHNKCKAFD